MSEQTQERAMFTHPYISSALAGDRQRERLARADQQRLVRQLRDHARASRRTQRAKQRPRRALRTVLRLRTEVQA